MSRQVSIMIEDNPLVSVFTARGTSSIYSECESGINQLFWNHVWRKSLSYCAASLHLSTDIYLLYLLSLKEISTKRFYNIHLYTYIIHALLRSPLHPPNPQPKSILIPGGHLFNDGLWCINVCCQKFYERRILNHVQSSLTYNGRRRILNHIQSSLTYCITYYLSWNLII